LRPASELEARERAIAAASTNFSCRRVDRGPTGSCGALSQHSNLAADGAARRLDAADVRIETLAHWTSPRSGVRYPARWRLSVPSAELRLEIEPG